MWPQKPTLEWHRAIYVPPHSFDMIVVQITSIASWKKTTRLEGSIYTSRKLILGFHVLVHWRNWSITIIHSLHLSFRCSILKCFQWNFIMHQIPLLLVTFRTKHLVWGLKNCIWLIDFLNPAVVLSWKTCRLKAAWSGFCMAMMVVPMEGSPVKAQTWAVGGYLTLCHGVIKHTLIWYMISTSICEFANIMSYPIPQSVNNHIESEPYLIGT